MIVEGLLRVHIPAFAVRFIVYPPDFQEIEDERQWDRSFAASQDFLIALADEARADLLAGRTEPLDPDQL